MATIVWFGRDLRLTDNPALSAAIARGKPIIPLYILDDVDAGEWAPGGASRWWLHGSLHSLDESLRQHGNALVLRRGAADKIITQLVAETRCDAVYWNRRYEPWAVSRAERLKSALRGRGIEARSFNAGLIREPWTILTQKGEPYRVFTPFWKALRAKGVPDAAAPVPTRIPALAPAPDSEPLSSWSLRPSAPDWAGALRSTWNPGEAGGQSRLEEFAAGAVSNYKDQRNMPGVSGTSRLSPHLHFGELSPGQVWRSVTGYALSTTGNPSPAGVETYLSEIAWREFSYHLLFHFPTLPVEPLRPEFSRFPWRDDAAALSSWQRGQTGYPIVDAGMRELWSIGWMHNRVRMIVASFLIKDLLLHWRTGAKWFWDTLVDADLASNSASWQWVAGCGADAAPYFRVFNPSLQGAKFDPDGTYVRRWVPEISRLPDALLHSPWEASPAELSDAGIRLGKDYPAPIVNHSVARDRALEAYRRIKQG